MLSEQVFKYCESKMYEMYSGDKKNGGGAIMDMHRKKQTILDSIIQAHSISFDRSEEP